MRQADALWETAASAPLLRSGGELPDGVQVRELRAHSDERGAFTEIFRRQWELGVDPVQWNVVHSEAGVLRGVHVHPRHDDYLTVVAGRAVIGLSDLRPQSPTRGLAALVELDERDPGAIRIPHGVAHGFLFLERSVHVYAVSDYWDPDDELLCRFDDPELGIAWPRRPASLSERDADAPPLRAVLDRLGW